MVDLLYCEILKLKRSKMFMISFLGAAAVPLMCFVEIIKMRIQYPDKIITFAKMFSDANLYVLGLVGVILYGVITSYLFNREYSENTLKSIMTIPVSKIRYIIGKYLMLFIWIMALTLISWGLLLILGILGQISDLNVKTLVIYLGRYLLGGFLIYMLTTPFVFLTLWLKNLVPSIILSAAITMVNVAILNDVDFVALFPWSAVFVAANGSIHTKYPLIYSYISIFSVSLIGFFASIKYFKSVDIK